MYRQKLLKLPNIKFHGNSFFASTVITRGKAHGQT
jgi:hypothetical protein